MNVRWIALCTLAFGCLANAQLAAPTAGWTVDARQSARPVLGFGGNYWLGHGGVSGVLSAAFSTSIGILKTGPTLLVLDPRGRVILREDAPDGPAIIGFSAQGKSALIYYPKNGGMARLDGARFATVATPWLDGDVVSVAQPDPSHAFFVLRRAGTLWKVEIRLADGATTSSEPFAGMKEPVLVQPDGSLLFQRAGNLVARAPGGAEASTRSEFRAGSLFPMGNGWIQVNEAPVDHKSAARHFAWNPSLAHPQVFQLPEGER